MKTEAEYRLEEIVRRDEKYGDIQNVYTPLPLGRKMLNKLPKLNSNMKILVMFNLEFIFIISNILGKENMQNVWFLSNGKLKRAAAIKLGINENHIISYKYNIKEININMKFDVIIGNPPYQGKRIGGGDASGNAIWQHFVELSFELLNENGYLCFIHPVEWRFDIGRKKILKAQKLLFSNQIIYLNLFNTPFKDVTTVVDWYVIQNIPKHTVSAIKYVDIERKKEINYEILLNYGSTMIDNILQKVLTVKDNNLYGRKSWGGLVIFDKSKPKGKYIFAHGMRSFGVKKIFKYFKYPHIHQYNKKVIIPDIGIFAVYDDGKLGIGDHLHYILVENKKQGLFFKRIIESNVMIFLQKIYSGDVWIGNSPKRWNSTEPFKRIKIDEVTLKTENDVYKYFKLSQEEINYIESHIKNIKK